MMMSTIPITTTSTTTMESVSSSSASYDHEAAVLESIHIAHKNRRVSACSMGSASTMSSMNMSMSTRSSTSSCLKDSSSRKSTDKSRRVSFCDKGHTCQEFDMYEPEQIEEIWFTADEYDEMKQSFEFTIFMMDAGCPEKVEDDDEHTCRGLEKRSEEGQWKRYERKRDYYNAVLDEQDRQWDIQEDDQQAISQIAVEVTRESFLEAQDQGVLDEIAAYGVMVRPGAVAAAAANDGDMDSVHTSANTVMTTESDYYGNESSRSWPSSEAGQEEQL